MSLKFKKRAGKKTPSQAFPQCPKCDGKEFLKCEGELICMGLNCDWNSIAINVEVNGCFQDFRRPPSPVTHIEPKAQSAQSESIIESKTIIEATSVA
jgi:hypothetical protein